MKKSLKKINLASVDDIFSTEESRVDNEKENIVDIPLNELYPFANHPFKVIDNEAMLDTVESIREYGVLVPAIVRPREAGGYELVAGHRRHRASELAGLETMPVIIRNLDDDESTIIMVDSNLQRESILPSERAFAFKLKLEAIKNQGKRTDLTSTQVAQKLSVEKIGDSAGISKDQVRRFIRLTELIIPLLDMVDEKKIAFNPAVELSYLKEDEQKDLLEAMEIQQATPSLSQAQRLKKISAEEPLDIKMICSILREEKKSDVNKVIISSDKIAKYFPKSYTNEKKEETILKLLESWYRQRMKEDR
ncbi:MAG: ParB/RepB/Spo0J family partition protein [Eubacteriales bacterium]